MLCTDVLFLLRQICILDIDVQGAQAVRKSALKAMYIFIKPPAPEEEELEKRLRGRLDVAADLAPSAYFLRYECDISYMVTYL